MKKKLAPSILSADFRKLGEEVSSADNAGAQYIHIDVMDGMFVPSISFGMPVIRSIRPVTDAVFDVHLMVQDPERYVEEFARLGADLITVHAEATKHLDRTLQQIHSLGKKTGVALNPATPLSVLDHVLYQTDMVLLMTVNPGFGGQKYIEPMTEKIRTLRNVCFGKAGRSISKWMEESTNRQPALYWKPAPTCWLWDPRSLTEKTWREM